MMFRAMCPESSLIDCDNESHHYTLIDSHPFETNVLGEIVCLCTKCYKVISFFPFLNLNNYLTLINVESGYRFRLFPDSNLNIYTASQYFANRIVSEPEIIEYTAQLLNVLCFLYSTASRADTFHFFFSPNFSLIDESNNWIISSLVGEYNELFVRGFNAPEMYSGVYNEQTDIFAFGMLLYWLATRIDSSEPPYKTPKVRKMNPRISWRLAKLIEKCIQPNPKKRYQSFCEIQNRFDKIRIKQNRGW